MANALGSHLSRRLLVGVILACTVLYMGEAKWAPVPWYALSPPSSSTNGVTHGSLPSGESRSSVDVPDAVVSKLVGKLGPLLGPDADMTVLPSTDGAGYSVTVTVNLGTDSVLPASKWLPGAVKNLPLFFERLFNSGVNVADGQIYFMHNESVVGGAGLGRTAYARLSIATATNQSSFVSTLSAVPQVTTEGSSQRWIQLVNTSPSVALQQPG